MRCEEKSALFKYRSQSKCEEDGDRCLLLTGSCSLNKDVADKTSSFLEPEVCTDDAIRGEYR